MRSFWVWLLCGLTMDALCAPIDENKLEAIGKICEEESGMDRTIINKALSASKLPEPTLPYLKYIECSYRRQGYLDQQDHIIFDAIKDMLMNFYTEDTINNVLEPCKEKHQPHNPPREMVYKVSRCIVRELVKYEESVDDNNV